MKKYITKTLLATIFEGLLNAPSNQLSPRLRKETWYFWRQAPALPLEDVFDFLVILSRIADQEASEFVKNLCAIDLYYERPNGPRSEPYPDRVDSSSNLDEQTMDE